MADARAYLDWNAGAPLLPAAREAVLAALDCANPSSVHAEGRIARGKIEAARAQVAALFGSGGVEVVFTSGATEAASTLLAPHWLRGRESFRFSRLYVCDADHPCTRNGGHFSADTVTRLPVHPSGILDLTALRDALAGHDSSQGLPLVTVHAANNESGVIQPWAEIGAIVRAAGGILVLDAVQAAGRIALDDMLEHADHLILSSHKLGGPKGAGAYVCKTGAPMPRALVAGGGQERGFRAGTENVPAVAGFGAAAAETLAKLDSNPPAKLLRDRFEQALLRRAPDAVIHGFGAPRLPNTLFFTVPGIKAETAQMAFDLAGVALSAGSACSSGKVGPSHVLKAMRFKAEEGALRVSIGPETTAADLERFTAALERVLRRRQSGSLPEKAA